MPYGFFTRGDIHSRKGCLKANKDDTCPCVLLMTADGGDYSQATNWYHRYERNLGWTNRGEVLGKEKTREAAQVAASL